MSDSGSFIMECLLLVVCMLVTANCSNNTTTSSSQYVMVTESTLIYYDMSTAYIVPTATSSVLSVTPTPGMGPDVEEMERNAVAMTFNNADLEQWVLIENAFLSIIAAECTLQCARSDRVDCGTMNTVNYTIADVVILAGYPRMVDDKLLVVFAVSLPSGAIPSNGVIGQDALLSIAAIATAAVTAQTGVEVAEISRYTAPVATPAAEDNESSSNLAVILPLTLIPAVILILVAAGFGYLCTWKLIKRHRKSLDLSSKLIKNEKVELMSYKATLV